MQKIQRKSNRELSIFIIQLSVVALVVLTVLIIKFLNGNWYNFLKGFYVGNFGADTKVSEITEAQEENIVYLSNKNQALTVMNTSIGEDLSNQLALPLGAYFVTSGYGYRQDPFGTGIEFHKGIDLAGETGENIYASADGTVEISQYSQSYGNYLVINHSGGLKTLYAHCSENLRGVGDRVKKGDIIAKVGSTGRSTGPHLHFEIILNGNNLNPEWLISKK